MIETLTKAVPTAVAPMSQPITDALVIDCGDPAARVCTDLWADNTPGSVERIALRDFQSQGEAIAAVVFVGKPTLAASQRIRAALGNQSWSKLCFVVDCSAYFGSNAAVRAECELLEHFAAAKPGIIRTGFVEQCRTFRRRLAEWSLVGGQRATFVDAAELVACVRNELNHPESRTVALLGESRTWFQQAKSAGGATKVVGGLVRYSGLGLGVRAVTKTAGRFSKRWRKLDFSTIRPTSEEELLTLCGSHNFRHLAICGYNNGVNHFGWKNPGRTVVPTTETGRNIEVDGDTLIVDAGLTLKTCIDELAANDKEFYVVPNYSYIGIGTTFFVPVHGSGSEVSTMGDTIEWVRLFDPETQQIIEAERGDELFEESMYNMRSGLVLLQLRFRVRPRAEYFARKYEVESPTAEEVWSLFDDPKRPTSKFARTPPPATRFRSPSITPARPTPAIV